MQGESKTLMSVYIDIPHAQIPLFCHVLSACSIFILQSSFDFGPSFMDEVLKALNEKEAKLESPDKESTPSQEDARIDWGDSKEKKQTPPPLPSQPPRMVGCDDLEVPSE